MNVTLSDCLYGAMNLTKNLDSNRYAFSGYSILFDAQILLTK